MFISSITLSAIIVFKQNMNFGTIPKYFYRTYVFL